MVGLPDQLLLVHFFFGYVFSDAENARKFAGRIEKRRKDQLHVHQPLTEIKIQHAVHGCEICAHIF